MNTNKILKLCNGYVEKNIGSFHDKKLEKLKKLKLAEILKRKNPYLFKARNIQLSQDLIKNFLDAYLSSQEESLFGDFLEGLAVFVNKHIYNGDKSSADGMDLEFLKDNKRYVISIKSGPNWGNSRQLAKLEDDFRKAKIKLNTSGSNIEVIAINGCCYGRQNKDKGFYKKICGQEFWELISGEQSLYLSIIEPLGFKAKERNEEFNKEFAKLINKFTMDFNVNFCPNGAIQWEKLVEYNSSSIPAIKLKKYISDETAR